MLITVMHGLCWTALCCGLGVLPSHREQYADFAPNARSVDAALAAELRLLETFRIENSATDDPEVVTDLGRDASDASDATCFAFDASDRWLEAVAGR